MPELLKQKTDVFKGLNNAMSPMSHEFVEGMASKSDGYRIDDNGLWSPQLLLTGIQGSIAATASPSGNGSHLKYLVVDNVPTIVSMAVSTSCDVGPNKKLYSTNGTGAVKNSEGNITTLSSPAKPTLTLNAAAGRQGDGTYYYMLTRYDTVFKVESLPSTVASTEINIKLDNKSVVVSGLSPTSRYHVRIYKTMRTCPAEGVYNSVNKFYLLAEVSSGTTYNDYLSDVDIADYEYEGRGTAPPSNIDYLVSFNNRMLYFKGNVLWWSGAGKPQEVAQKYSLVYDTGILGSGSTTLTDQLPKLSVGAYGEAYTEIAELAGQKVLAAIPYRGKLYVWTDTLMGYIQAANRLEGYKFYTLRNGVGITSDKVLALSPYGLFGADHQGIWLLTGSETVYRISDGIIDFHDSAKSTYLTNANFDDAFGVWCPAINEYWFGITGKIVAYQAARGTFAGPYSYAITGGTTFRSQNYLTGGLTPSTTQTSPITAELIFWFGQSNPSVIKDGLSLELMFERIASCNATVIQNSTSIETGSTGTTSKTLTSVCERISPISSGQMFRLRLQPSGDTRLAVISYKYNGVGWSKEFGR